MEMIAATCSRPSDTYLSRAQLDEFERWLQERRRDLCQLLEPQTDPHQDELRQPDWLDSASVSSQRELSLVNRERTLRNIREIDAALGRIKDGSYGFCCESGEEIGLKRLQTLPTARFSVETQERLERCRRQFCRG